VAVSSSQSKHFSSSIGVHGCNASLAGPRMVGLATAPRSHTLHPPQLSSMHFSLGKHPCYPIPHTYGEGQVIKRGFDSFLVAGFMGLRQRGAGLPCSNCVLSTTTPQSTLSGLLSKRSCSSLSILTVPLGASMPTNPNSKTVGFRLYHAASSPTHIVCPSPSSLATRYRSLPTSLLFN
jgi:hypothetical protein